MKINNLGEKVFYYSTALRLRYAAVCLLLGGGGAVLSILAINGKMGEITTNGLRAAAFLALMFCLFVVFCIYAKRALTGVCLKIGPNYFIINSARYHADEIDAIIHITDGSLCIAVDEDAFKRQSVFHRIAHRYGFAVLAAALTSLMLLTFDGLKKSPVKAFYLVVADILLIKNALIFWKNYNAYPINNPAKDDIPFLSAEAAEFCKQNDIVYTEALENDI